MTLAEMKERARADSLFVAGQFVWVHPGGGWGSFRVQIREQVRDEFVRGSLRTVYQSTIVETSSQDMGSCQLVGPVYHGDGSVDYPSWWPQLSA